MQFKLSPNQKPIQALTQLLVSTTVHEIHTVLSMDFVEFSVEDLHSVGLTDEVLSELQDILDKLKALSAKAKAEHSTPSTPPTPLPPA